MEITLATVGRRTARKHVDAGEMFAGYCQRIGRFVRCHMDNYSTEEKFLAAIRTSKRTDAPAVQSQSLRWAENSSSKRSMPLLLLLDSRGRSFSSGQFAHWLQKEQEKATRHLFFAVGPADGWSDIARESVSHGRGLLLSLGPMTLPHELAAVVLAEQIYRAFTIIEGHPYHLGHV